MFLTYCQDVLSLSGHCATVVVQMSVKWIYSIGIIVLYTLRVIPQTSKRVYLISDKMLPHLKFLANFAYIYLLSFLLFSSHREYVQTYRTLVYSCCYLLWLLLAVRRDAWLRMVLLTTRTTPHQRMLSVRPLCCVALR